MEHPAGAHFSLVRRDVFRLVGHASFSPPPLRILLRGLLKRRRPTYPWRSSAVVFRPHRDRFLSVGSKFSSNSPSFRRRNSRPAVGSTNSRRLLAKIIVWIETSRIFPSSVLRGFLFFFYYHFPSRLRTFSRYDFGIREAPLFMPATKTRRTTWRVVGYGFGR